MRPGTYRKGATSYRRNVRVYFREYARPKPRKLRGAKYVNGHPGFYSAAWVFKRMPGRRKP